MANHIREVGTEFILDQLGVNESDKKVAGLVAMLAKYDTRIKKVGLTREKKFGSYDIEIEGALSQEELVVLLSSRGFLNPNVRTIDDVRAQVQVNSNDVASYWINFYFKRG